jgi:hypothetical protein
MNFLLGFIHAVLGLTALAIGDHFSWAVFQIVSAIFLSQWFAQ